MRCVRGQQQLTEKRNDDIIHPKSNNTGVGNFGPLEDEENRDEEHKEWTWGTVSNCESIQYYHVLNRVWLRTLTNRSTSRLSKIGEPSGAGGGMGAVAALKFGGKEGRERRSLHK